jgi:hypothetical protein
VSAGCWVSEAAYSIAAVGCQLGVRYQKQLTPLLLLDVSWVLGVCEQLTPLLLLGVSWVLGICEQFTPLLLLGVSWVLGVCEQLTPLLLKCQ